MELELKQIKELMTAMGRSGMTKLILKIGDRELHLERAEESKALEMPLQAARGASPEPFSPLFPTHQPLVSHGSPALPAAARAEAEQASPAKEPEGRYITSPMVGTCYFGPSPDEPPFVKVGDKIEPTTVVGIIEAMKVMNEVKAGISGVVAEVLVENGHPVEFGTKLFRII